ncbi:MAG: TonB-dependent receptor [Lacibacter sp.]
MLVLFTQQISLAQLQVGGTVVDASTQKPIAGATVSIQGQGATATNEAGRFAVEVGRKGTYKLLVTSIGYQQHELDVQVQQTVSGLLIALEAQSLFLQPVEIRASRAADHAPFAKFNLTKAEIEKRNQGQDIPFLLNHTPSVVVTSDAGNGVGYTGLRIRGTDATRINMTINGIPYNDAESQGIFFVNLPDLASSVASVQIQRGVGTSTNGAGAFGATMNFSTNEFNEKAYAEVNNSAGSFHTWKHTVKVGSGLISNHFTLDARLSRITSDGFIDRAATDLRSFYLSGAYLSKKTSIRFNIISGKEKTYQAWNGIPEAKLRNQPDALLAHYFNNIGVLYFTRQDSLNLFNSDPRRFNVYLYENQTDNYQQDHYQFFLNHAWNPNLNTNLTLFWSKGAGYYEQFRHNNRFSSYGLPDVQIGTTRIRRTDLIRQLWLDNDFYGGLYSVQYKKDRHELIVGGGYSEYRGDHFGEIIWAAIGIPNRYRWYDFDAVKTDANTYAKWNYRLSDYLELFTDLQYRAVRYSFTGTRKYPTVVVDDRWDFVNPKLGLTYRKNNNTLYASYAVGNKEPNRDDYERDETDPRPKREQLHNIEAGFTQTTATYNWNANFFYMRYRDQLVLTGAINDVGDAIRTNVPNSFRLGIELQGAYKFNSWLDAEGNITWSRNRILNFTDLVPEYDSNFDLIGNRATVLGSTPMSFSPDWVSSFSINTRPLKRHAVSLISKGVSDQFMDNTANPGRVLPGYFVQDLRWIWTLPLRKLSKAELLLQINNIWNTLYETNGYTYSFIVAGQLFTENFFFPMAGRNYMVGLNIRF